MGKLFWGRKVFLQWGLRKTKEEWKGGGLKKSNVEGLE